MKNVRLPESEGFASAYFLTLFLSTITLTAMLLVNMENQIKADYNAKNADIYLGYEAQASAYVKCSLRNKKIPSGEVSYADCSLKFLPLSGSHLTCILSAEIEETIQFEIDAEQYSLFDYKVIRNTGPQ